MSDDAAAGVLTSTYDLLRERLRAVAERLRDASQSLNDERCKVFAATPMTLAEQDRLRTEIPSIPTDAVSVDGLLLFGYNTGTSLGRTRTVNDTFTLLKVAQAAANDWTFTPVAPDEPAWFLADASFQRDANELYTYYSDTRLDSLILNAGRLLMVFRFGPAPDDIRVLRWQVDGSALRYVDAYGDHDLVETAPYDFAWHPVGRDHMVEGRWPHAVVAGVLHVGFDKAVLDFRIEDAVEGGRSIHREPVDESGQVIAETPMSFAEIGEIVLVRVHPYRETGERFFLFNRLTRAVQRVDAIGRNCHLLPEGQGVVFPGGYHLQNGENRVFTTDATGFRFHTVHRSPNGEDILYVYRKALTGEYLLCPYNVVNRTMDNPVLTLGYAVFADGVIVCLRHSPEPQRVHTISVYTSPFCTPDHYVPTVPSDSFFGRVGNPEIVRVLGESISLSRDAADPLFNAEVFEAIVARSTTLLDGYGWLNQPEACGIGGLLGDLRKASGSVLDEFASVVASKKEAAARLGDVERVVSDLSADAELELRDAGAFIDKLAATRNALGAISELSEVRQVDLHAVAGLRERTQAVYDRFATRAIGFLDSPESLDTILKVFDESEVAASGAPTAAAVRELGLAVDEAGNRIVMLTEVVGGLQTDDVTRKTAVLSRLSDGLARRNSVRAGIDRRSESLRSTEAEAGFAAAMSVLSQRATASISAAGDAAACDASLAALIAELENIELAFGDVNAFADAIDTRRNELHTAFSQRRDALAADRTRRIDRVVQSAERILATIATRAAQLPGRAEIDSFFATDGLVNRIRSSAEELRGLGEAGRAGELDVALVTARDQARRAATDRSELFEAGTVKVGRWKFGVNNEPFELRLATDDHGAFRLRLTGTDLQLALPDNALGEYADLATQSYVSELPWLPRAVYLAFEAHREGITVDGLQAFATSRIEDGYEPGVHDADALKVLAATRALWGTPALYIDGRARTIAARWLAALDHRERAVLDREIAAVRALPTGTARQSLISQIAPRLHEFAAPTGLVIDSSLAAGFLIDHAHDLAVSGEADDLARQFRRWAGEHSIELRDATLEQLVRWVTDSFPGQPQTLVAEVAWRLLDDAVTVVPGMPTVTRVDGLVSQHPLITDGTLRLDVSEVYSRYLSYRTGGGTDRFRHFATVRRSLLAAERTRLELDRLRPTVISSFVRNRLIDEVYLPLIGDNLARQMGLNGAAQGLLLLISPPGYGKTTLLEYVTDLLGFALVKINGPALGTEVTSLDPAAAPNAAAAEELAKLNRAFAMGNNVVVMIDDIQHTSPEFLQKFIPLCDATRRIEGVLEGQARTFALSGKRFAMVMAGNPYTSSGDSFRIPDMLANRADVHNLGDVASTAADAFAQSFVENACGVNETLGPVLTRGRGDLAVLLRAARGEQVRSDELAHPYGATELTQITRTLSHLLRVRDQLLKVNAAYIASATVGEAMRGEPAFLLQGSYRNMARIAQRIVAAMTDVEVDRAIDDHYRAESQTLASAAGWNLAKLAEVLGGASAAQLAEIDTLRQRWRESHVTGDPTVAMAAALRDIAESIRQPRHTS